MKKSFAAALLSVLAGCSSLPRVDLPDMPSVPRFGLGGGAEGERVEWRCASGADFSVRINEEARTATVSTGLRTIRLDRTDSGYSNGEVTYFEQGGMASLSGVDGRRFTNCRKD